MRPAPALSVEGLTVTAGSSVLLREVSLRVPRGRVVGLAGESGAGKTTLAHAVLRLLPAGAAAHGRVLLDGEDVLTASWGRLRALRWAGMSLVVQDSLRALDPLRRVVDQVAAPVRLHQRCRRAEAVRRALAALAEVGLSGGQARARPHELSGGQRQRALLAAALVLGPRVLIADEPTTDLDAGAERSLLALLADRARRLGTGVLLISHDLPLLARCSDEVYVLHAGEVVAHGPAARLGLPRRPAARGPLARTAAAPPSSGLDGGPRGAPPAPRPPLLAGRGLTVRAAGRTGEVVLAGVELALHAGEVVALVGPSGVGKTTLARTLAGLRRPARGTVLLDGIPLSHGRAGLLRHRRAVQYLPQNAAQTLNPAHRARRVVGEGLRIHGSGAQSLDDQVRAALAAVAPGALADLLDRLPSQLSTGQRQRVALAAAVAVGPRVLLADEPTAGLDARAREEALEVLVGLARGRGTAVLLITHDVAAVRVVADRVVRLVPPAPGAPPGARLR